MLLLYMNKILTDGNGYCLCWTKASVFCLTPSKVFDIKFIKSFGSPVLFFD